MRRPRRLLATSAQQAEVLRRVDAGETYREVALAVFGDAGAKDRVTIIVRRRAERALEEQLRAERPQGPALVDRSLPVEEQVAALEEIRANVARLDRLRELTREPD